MIARGPRERGFTLVELLVSLAILAMMGALLVEGLHGGRRVWARIESRSRDRDSLLAAQMRLADLIERAIPQTSYAGSRPFARFEGGPVALTMLGDTRADGGIDLNTLELAADGRLIVSRQPDPAPFGSPPFPATTPLLGRVERIEFGYFGAAPPDNERRWRSAWTDQPTLPELIRLRLAFAPGDRRRWPELVLRPAATIDTGCVFEPATGRCKGRG